MVAASLLLWPVAGTDAVLRRCRRCCSAPRSSSRRTGCCAGPAPRPRGTRRPGRRSRPAMRLFHGSITYLTLLFVAVAIDPLLPF